MKQIYGFLNQLTESYQQERQPHKLLGLFYLTPEQRLKILEDIMAPYSEEEAKLSQEKDRGRNMQAKESKPNRNSIYAVWHNPSTSAKDACVTHFRR
ncbi:hypothetical protein ACM55O_11435 [Hafnia paralvei]|uniref:hypothetical protein n=2 Tax=Hafnia TaxID=568 RepID=UPI0029DD1D6A|nr:hypothetical protein [Hafnia paralvei]MDX6839447.1 hypothetical protein [Hafnia paralvei]